MQKCKRIFSPFSDNIEQKWHPELRHYSAAPILLVGTKSDLRGDAKVVAGLAKKKLEPITFAQGVALSKYVFERNIFTKYRILLIFLVLVKKDVIFLMYFRIEISECN